MALHVSNLDYIELTKPRGVLEDQHLGPVLYYHYYTPEAKQTAAGNSGYRFGWNELGFQNGWPYVK